MGWRTASIKENDTIHRLALRELGTAEKWADIVALNGLRPPYLGVSESQGVLPYGGTILLPIYRADSVAEITDPFLTDILLDEDGFIMTDGNGDIATVSGVENLKQALKMRVVSRKRQLLFHPDYGCWAYSLIGSVIRNSVAQLAKFYAESAMREDWRISGIENTDTYLIKDSVSLVSTVIPVSGDAVTFQATI